MSASQNAASENIFKNRCPQRGAILCQAHKKSKRLRYVQPEIPASFKPVQKYSFPEQELQGTTTYDFSYLPISFEEAQKCRMPPVSRKSNMGLMPGSMQDTTTNRHDYTMKPIMRSTAVVPGCTLAPLSAKLDSKTVSRDSYKSPGRPDPSLSFKPVHVFHEPEVPLQDSTTSKESYQRVKIPPREIPPWKPRSLYVRPEQAMAGDSIYNGSYLPPGAFEEVTPLTSERSDSGCIGNPCLCGIPTATEDL